MVASQNLMLELFVECNRIREFCNTLQSEAETMQEVSMNAAIAAGHTGGHIRTFTEIARQIGSSSTRLSSKVQKMKADTNLIVNETLSAMIRAMQLAQFEKGMSGVRQEANIELVQSRITELETAISGSVEKIYRDVQVVVADLRAVEEIQKRVWAVITRLRIEASTMAQEEQVFVLSIGDSLSASLDRALGAFSRLFETVKQFESKLVTPRDSAREHERRERNVS